MSATALYDAIGPRGRRRITVGSIIGGLLLAGIVAVALLRLAQNNQLEAERWEVLTNEDVQRRLFVDGLLNGTLKAAGVAILLALAFGGLLAMGRISQFAVVRGLTTAWVEFFRGLPLLLLIYFLFLAGPQLGVTVPVFWALVLGLTLYNSAVIAEIFRAGILSLPKGQTEAAYAIGLRRVQTLRMILLPQGVRLMLPALVSQLVTLLKDTALGFIVAYPEMLRIGREIVEFLGGPYSLPIYVELVAIYIAVNTTLSWFARWLDRRTARRYGKAVEMSAADEAA
jgi:glutamate transport system permease protein